MYPFACVVYSKRQHQYSVNAAMTLVILLSLKSMESLEKRVTTYFEETVDSIGFNESCTTSDIAALRLTLGVNGPL